MLPSAIVAVAVAGSSAGTPRSVTTSAGCTTSTMYSGPTVTLTLTGNPAAVPSTAKVPPGVV